MDVLADAALDDAEALSSPAARAPGPACRSGRATAETIVLDDDGEQRSPDDEQAAAGKRALHAYVASDQLSASEKQPKMLDSARRRGAAQVSDEVSLALDSQASSHDQWDEREPASGGSAPSDEKPPAGKHGVEPDDELDFEEPGGAQAASWYQQAAAELPRLALPEDPALGGPKEPPPPPSEPRARGDRLPSHEGLAAHQREGARGDRGRWAGPTAHGDARCRPRRVAQRIPPGGLPLTRSRRPRAGVTWTRLSRVTLVSDAVRAWSVEARALGRLSAAACVV